MTHMFTMRRRFPLPALATLLPGLAVAVLVLLLCGHAAAQERTLTLVSWGGAYARACEKGYIERFERETGIDVQIEDYNGGLAQIRAQVDVGNVYWDVVDMELPDMVRGCDEGLLVPIDVDELAPGADGTPAADDLPEDGLTECGPTNLFYSTVVVYNDARIGTSKPASIADFFDLEKFPGRRGMRRSPLANLEFALMADGVAADEVYATLDTEAGVRRAFRKLDSIKDRIVWWEAGAQPPQMLADGEVVMTTAYNGRIFNAQVLEEQPFVIVWDGQLLDTGGLVIVEGTRNLEAAKQFVRFANTARAMADVGRYISYSPTRRSALDLISTHAETGVDMRPHMPTSPDNIGRALHNDWEWWSDNGEEMNERFSTWLAR
ncbi:MAG: ABC transporter substrate-binding protein [Gemmatimonadetes bacterium]|nr:ABC transporter substrate-binding protein [Gemmatimonadota bacterium]